MAEKSGAPDYPTTKVDPTLYGSSVTNAGGTTYNPTDFEKSLVSTSQGGITKTLNQLLNPTYDSADFNKYKSDLQTQQQNGFENNVLSPLVSRGLLGTSGAANLANQYGSTMNQQTSDLMDNYKNQNSNLLKQLMSVYAMPYDMMNGTSSLSQGLANSVGNYNLANTELNNKANAAMWSALSGNIGSYGGSGGSNTSDKAAQAASMAAMMSDRKSKKNIKKISEKNGINIYEFEYKPEYKQPEGKHIGVIAQEVEHIPNAVIEKDGIKYVDYNIILPLVA